MMKEERDPTAERAFVIFHPKSKRVKRAQEE